MSAPPVACGDSPLWEGAKATRQVCTRPRPRNLSFKGSLSKGVRAVTAARSAFLFEESPCAYAQARHAGLLSFKASLRSQISLLIFLPQSNSNTCEAGATASLSEGNVINLSPLVLMKFSRLMFFVPFKSPARTNWNNSACKFRIDFIPKFSALCL